MARTRLNPMLSKINRSYTVEEVARTYGLNRETVRRWLRVGGLSAIDDRRPALIQGVTLRVFLAARRQAAKQPTPPGMLHCFGCRAGRPPALGMADYLRPDGAGPGNLRALCEACGTIMNRRARWAVVPAILPGIEVRVVEQAGRIAERPTPPVTVTSSKDGNP